MLNNWCNNMYTYIYIYVSKSQMVAFLYVFPLFSVKGGWVFHPFLGDFHQGLGGRYVVDWADPRKPNPMSQGLKV